MLVSDSQFIRMFYQNKVKYFILYDAAHKNNKNIANKWRITNAFLASTYFLLI